MRIYRGIPDGSRLIHLLPRPPAYAAKWHAVNDWASTALIPLDVDVYADPWGNARVTGWRGARVADLDNEEEAYANGVPLQRGFNIVPKGPNRERGGTRRVSIRALTWEVDEISRMTEVARDPKWITTGWGMTARSATDRHFQYVHRYAGLVATNRASRLLVVTAWEIVFWTADKNADYV